MSPIINDADAASFLKENPTQERVESLAVSELRVICSLLGEKSTTNLDKPELVNILTRKLFGRPEGESETDNNTFLGFPDPSQSAEPSGLHEVQEEQEEELHLDMDNSRQLGGQSPLPPPNMEDGMVSPIPDGFADQNQTLYMQLQLELAKARTLDRQIQLATLTGSNNISNTSHSPSKQFDLAGAVKLMPQFSHENVDEFFSSFERLARKMEWPQRYWTVLLQHSLRGKAQRAYSSLPDSDADNYFTVKEEILRAYSLVPEAYRKRFRGLQKKQEQTYLEFASNKREALSRWLKSVSVNNFESLVDLLLVEDFLRSVNKEVSTYLLDKEFSTIEQAARQADNYQLNHQKAHYSNHTQFLPHNKSPRSPNLGSNFGKPDKADSPHKNNPPQSSNKARNTPKYSCTNCGRAGHTAYFCWRRKGSLDPARPIMCASGTSVPSATPSVNTAQAKPEQSTSQNKTVALLVPLVRSDSSVGEVNPAHVCDRDPNLGTYGAFLSSGTVTSKGDTASITVLRDTGSLQTLLRAGVVEGEETGKFVVLTSIWGRGSVPLFKVSLDTTGFVGPALVAMLPVLPVPDVDLILGNDLAGGHVSNHLPPPILSERPEESEKLRVLEEELPEVFPLCAVTRSMTRRQPAVPPVDGERRTNSCEKVEKEEVDLNLSSIFEPPILPSKSFAGVKAGKEALIEAQQQDVSLQPLLEEAQSEVGETGSSTTYFLRDGVLCRRWLPPVYKGEDVPWASVIQIMVPTQYRKPLVELAHDGHLAGHFGVRRTLAKLQQVFYWPGIRRDVTTHVKVCVVCQKVGKCNSKIPPAPLINVPCVPEPFSTIQIDIVGPLPKTSKGNEYILTMLDVSTKYLHAVPLRRISAKLIVEHLINFFGHFGMPVILQTDGASYFTGRVFENALAELGIQHRVSSPYHPQTQGAVERSQQTIKSVLRKFSEEFQGAWDSDLPFLLISMRDAVSDSTGLTPYELVFSHQVRGPLHVVRDKLLGSTSDNVNLLELVGDLKLKLLKLRQLAVENVVRSKARSKVWYDRCARQR